MRRRSREMRTDLAQRLLAAILPIIADYTPEEIELARVFHSGDDELRARFIATVTKGDKATEPAGVVRLDTGLPPEQWP